MIKFTEKMILVFYIRYIHIFLKTTKRVSQNLLSSCHIIFLFLSLYKPALAATYLKHVIYVESMID